MCFVLNGVVVQASAVSKVSRRGWALSSEGALPHGRHRLQQQWDFSLKVACVAVSAAHTRIRLPETAATGLVAQEEER